MNFFVVIPSIIFTMFSVAIISYISIATMVGPWIAPTIVLMSSVVLRLRTIPKSREETNKEMVLIQTVGSVGGIIAIGIGFSLPTLYFLDSATFNSWLQSPLYFCSIIAAICFSAGGFGIWLARCFADKFIEKDNLSFPVSQLIHKMITSQTQGKQAKSMFLGLGSSWIVCFFRDGLLAIKGFLPKVFYLLPSLAGKEIAISIMPMLWAVGFLIGINIAFPLLVGMVSKYLVLFPINYHANFLPFNLFLPLKDNDFITAFCSGLVIAELILGLLKYPGIIWNKIKNFSGYNFFSKAASIKGLFKKKKLIQATDDEQKINWFDNGIAKLLLNLEAGVSILASVIFLLYLGFSFVSIVFLLIFTVLATYQISYLSAKIGLLSFGRFATFIMIPMMLMFKLDFVQITFLCVFFNICAAAASDLLFDYKVGKLCNVSFKQIHRYQWLGLVVTSLCMGLFLWLLFTNFQIGSADLFAQRGKSRALLIQSLSFDWYVVFIGFLYGVILKKLKVSPTMVFGGILMPNSLTLGLVIGAVGSWFSKNANEQLPFWSGVFAGESIWILVSILLKMFC